MKYLGVILGRKRFWREHLKDLWFKVRPETRNDILALFGCSPSSAAVRSNTMIVGSGDGDGK